MNLGQAALSLAGFHFRNTVRVHPLKARLRAAAQELDRARHLARHELWRLHLMLIHIGLVERPGSSAPPKPETVRAVQRRYYALLNKDWENAQRGAYPAKLLTDSPALHRWRDWPALIADLKKVNDRAKRGDYLELPPGSLEHYPPYYARCFHWQSDGYLSAHSARLYELEVELLFLGCAGVMRRQALVPLCKPEQTAPTSLLDIACGTGAFLKQAEVALPNASLHGIDLSPYYAARASEAVPRARIVTGNAEQLPYEDNSFDAVTSVFLFHELPKHIRRKILAEALRVLKPGGRIVIEDAAQLSESPELSEVLERFYRDLHEPYFKGYLRDPLEDALREYGFKDIVVERCFVSKVVSATL